MTKTAQHLSIITLIGFMLALVGYGGVVSTAAPYQATLEATPGADQATSQAANVPATRPTILLDLNGGLVDGVLGSYCWPSSGTAPQCDFVEEVPPGTPVSVTEGADLKFQLDPASPAPQEFRATLTDDKAADGSPIRVDLAKTGGVYKIEGLGAGGHHILVEAFYPGESAESQYFVSYTFLLQIGSVSIAMATESGTAEAATAESTVVEVTAAAPPSEVPTSIVVTTAEAPTPELPTVEPPTVAPPTAEAPTAEAPTAEAPTAAVPGVESPTPQLPTAVPPTVVPPTVVPPTAVPPTAVPPTVVPTPIVLQPTVVPPTAVAAAPTTASAAPGLTVIVAGRKYDPVAVNACVVSSDGTQTCVRRPSNAAAERIFAAPGDTAQIVFQGPRPTTITANILSADAVSVISKQAVTPDNLALYVLPTNAGNYVLAVDIAWPAGTATYYYRLTVNG